MIEETGTELKKVPDRKIPFSKRKNDPIRKRKLFQLKHARNKQNNCFLLKILL